MSKKDVLKSCWQAALNLLAGRVFEVPVLVGSHSTIEETIHLDERHKSKFCEEYQFLV
jgi:hypothetical protein